MASVKGFMGSVTERFMDKVSPCPLTGCWWWTGAVGGSSTSPRPVMWVDGVNRRASHVSLLLAYGIVVDQANHHCDQEMCVNPAHLYGGTQPENVRDMHARGRDRNQNSGKTHCDHGHPFDTDNTYHRPDGDRMCRSCNREAQKRYALNHA